MQEFLSRCDLNFGIITYNEVNLLERIIDIKYLNELERYCFRFKKYIYDLKFNAKVIQNKKY